MSSEITVNAKLGVVEDHVDAEFTTDGDITFDLSNTRGNYAGGVVKVGYATHEAVPVSDLTNVGWAWFKHVGDGNFIELGVVVSSTFYPFARLYEGEICLTRLSKSATIYAKSDTADQYMEYAIFDE